MKAAVILAALAAAACATPGPQDAGPSAALGEIADVGALKVRPIAIVEDSRCPIDVMCVWAGRVVVRSELIGGSWTETRDLELGRPQQLADGSLTLVEVQPPKRVDQAVDLASYRFTFRLEGGL